MNTCRNQLGGGIQRRFCAPCYVPNTPVWCWKEPGRGTITRSFHQERLKKDTSHQYLAPLPTDAVGIRTLSSDDEIACVSWLRAKAFYAYPPERAFAGEIHQMMIAEEESKSLKALRMDTALREKRGDGDWNEKTITLVALCHVDALDTSIDDNLCFVDVDGSTVIVVGSLDVHFAKALPGEVLIGSSEHAAYLANVCTADAAKRRGVAALLLQRAREIARENNADDIFVHTMAVNEIARAFYEKNGFVVEKEETSNQAHYRGRCPDGVEGLARTVLLRDSFYST